MTDRLLEIFLAVIGTALCVMVVAVAAGLAFLIWKGISLLW